MEKTRVAIIGAGTAGLSAVGEIMRCSQAFILVDPGPLGTTCARVACMPSKALVEAANRIHEVRRLGRSGFVDPLTPRVEPDAVMRHVRALRDHFVASVKESMEREQQHWIRSAGRFNGPGSIATREGVFAVDAVVIAVGSRPRIPEAWRSHADQILTTDSVFELDPVPSSLAVVGAGAAGLEMAQAFTRLGVVVRVHATANTLGGLTDPDVIAYARERLERELSMTIHEEHPVPDAEAPSLRIRGTQDFPDRVLLATGRVSNLDQVGLDRSGLETDASGQVCVDPETLRAAGPGRVYIAGDSNRARTVLHEAADEGRIAGLNAVADHETAYRRRARLRIVFTDPQMAIMGATHAELSDAIAAGEVCVGESTFDDQGRARLMDQRNGIIRIYADHRTGTLLGSEMFGPHVEHLAHLLASQVDLGLTVHRSLGLPVYHPVLEECLRTALRDLADRVVPDRHLFALSPRDRAA